MAKVSVFPSGGSRSRPPAWCRRSSAPAARSAACWRCRCTRCATSCATSWCRSTANIQLPNCSRPAATIPAFPTPSASPSNTSCSRASMIPSTTPRRWCGCSRAFRPRSISFRSIPGRAANMNVPTGNRSRNFRKWYSTPAMPRLCAPRAAATFSPPAASSRARRKSSPRASALALRAMAMTD